MRLSVKLASPFTLSPLSRKSNSSMPKLLPVSDSDASFTPPHDQPPLKAPTLPTKNAAAVELTERSYFFLANARAGRQSKFTAEDDLILLRNVFAARAHVALQGETRERFEVVASKANACRKLTFAVT